MNTPGATKAAAVIMDGRLAIDTEYGRKSAEGIADLIDQKTGAGELLEACKQTWHYIHSLKRPGEDRDNPSYTVNIVEGVLRAAIAKAEGVQP